MFRALWRRPGMILNKKGRIYAAFLLFLIASLCRVYCLYGAHVCTGTTIGADIRVDFIYVSLRNSFDRTFINTGSACSAIFADFVSHDLYC